MYKIKYKKPLKELTEIFSEQDIETVSSGDNEIEVNPKDEREAGVFFKVLSLFIVYAYFKDMLIQELIKKGKSNKQAEELAVNESHVLQETNYFSNITRILILEHFKNNTKLNIDSFFIFNIKGLKEEIRLIAEAILAEENGELDEFMMDNETYEVQQGLGQPPENMNVFDMIRQNASIHGLDFNDFSQINVFNINGRLTYKNKKGLVLDEKFFVTYLGSSLSFNNTDDSPDGDLLQDVLLFNCVNNIFEIKEVVIHKGVTQRADEILRYNIKHAMGYSAHVNVTYCPGCNECR